MDTIEKATGVLGLGILLFWGAVIICWPWNLYKLTQCDFDSDTSWKPEAIHAIGLLPPASLATVWYGTDKPQQAKGQE